MTGTAPPTPAAPVLLVEDDPTTSDVVRAYLERDGYHTVVCASGGRALDVLRQVSPRCIVLDVMLPERDGFEICQELRRRGSTIPILILSGRADELDRIRGLRLGADDYLIKPFSPRELVARVQALLRRSEIGPQAPQVLALGNLELIAAHHEVRVAGRAVDTTHFEFGLIATLLAHPGRVFTRGQLLAHVHGMADAPTPDRTVDPHVVRIRDKLEQAGSTAWIVTVRGVGYKLATDARTR